MKKGQYVMARHGDSGGYGIGNVKIILCEHNHVEGNLGRPNPKSEETKQKLRLVHLGKKASEEAKLKMSAFQKGRKHGPLSAETKLKLRLTKLGKKGAPHTEESKLRQSQIRKEWWVRYRAKYPIPQGGK